MSAATAEQLLPVPSVPEQLRPPGLYYFLNEFKRSYEMLAGQLQGAENSDTKYASQRDLANMVLDRSGVVVLVGQDQVNIPVNVDVLVAFTDEQWDFQGDFDSASSIFSAPLDGIYLVMVTVSLTNLDVSASSYDLKIITSNGTYQVSLDPSKFTADFGPIPISFNRPLLLDVNDTLQVMVHQTGGVAQTTIQASASWLACSFQTGVE